MPIEEESGKRKKAGKGAELATTARNPFKRKTVMRTWAGYSDLLMAEAIRHVIWSGAYIGLSKTGDGGALSIMVLEGDVKHRTYCATAEEVEEALTALIEQYDMLTGE